jgi:hypothetical protein
MQGQRIHWVADDAEREYTALVPVALHRTEQSAHQDRVYRSGAHGIAM